MPFLKILGCFWVWGVVLFCLVAELGFGVVLGGFLRGLFGFFWLIFVWLVLDSVLNGYKVKLKLGNVWKTLISQVGILKDIQHQLGENS